MKILCVGAHPDDLEVGCYGTIKKYKEQGAEIFYLVLSYGEDGGDKNQRVREQEKTAKMIGAELKFGGLRSAHLANDSGRATIALIEDAIKTIQPDIIFTHTSHDRHQDHRLVNSATVSACRSFQGELYFYEGFSSLKYFTPNLVHRIDKYFDEKIQAISCFTSQSKKFYMNEELVKSVAEFRAAQFGFLGKAEAFELGGMIK